MKVFICSMLLLGMALAGEVDPLKSDEETNTELWKWMSPNLASGYLTFFFLVFVSYNAFLLLGSI